ncbi:hypothetical protein HPMBJEAJ_00412 [Aeromonas phage avDM6]|nr:hypothetical protein HPMBJEAJ_00412 [Aeromonas phage avDM6]
MKKINSEEEYQKSVDIQQPEGTKLDPNRPRLDDGFLVVIRFDSIRAYYNFINVKTSSPYEVKKSKLLGQSQVFSDGEYLYMGFIVDSIDTVKPYLTWVDPSNTQFAFGAICELGIAKKHTIDFFYDNIKTEEDLK